MLPFKTIKLNYTNYLIFTLCCTCIVFTPVFSEFAINYMNPNNSGYINEIHIKHYVKIFFSILFFAGLINIPFLFFNKWGLIIYLIFLSLTLYVTSFIDFIHVLIFQSGTNSSSWYAIFSTHKSEALEFIFDYSSINLAIGIIVFILFPIVVYFIAVLLSSWKFKKIFFIIYLVCYVASVLFIVNRSEFSYINEISFFKFYNSYIDYKKEIKKFNLQSIEKHELNIKKRIFHDKETHIIIIGESTSKYHMQLYGYNRPTTPELEKIKDKLIVFNNVKTSYAHTIASLMEALFLNDDYTLIDLFNSAGVKTYWLSNQKFLGENETIISSLANRTNKKIFINPIGENKIDGDLLYELDKLLKENASHKVIFIHLMGTHLSYQDRYPVEYNHFTSKNISPFGDHADSFINHYDNAVLYNDFVVSEIIKRCDALGSPCSAIYFSDHGDEVYDFRDFHGHSQTLLSKYMTSIPFIIFLNNSLKNTMQKSHVFCNENSEKEFSLKQFPNTIQDLLGIESDYYNKTQSFFYKDSSFQNLKNIETDSIIINNTQPFPTFKSKLWAHRVNSIERFNLLRDKFSGMELDVVYENGKFDVRHPHLLKQPD